MEEAYHHFIDHAQKNTVAFFSYNPEGASKKQQDHADYFTRLMFEKGIVLRAILPNFAQVLHDATPVFKKYHWEARVLPLSQYSWEISMMVSGDFLVTTSRNAGQSLVIENKDLANAQRQIFEIAWESKDAKKMV